MARKEFNIFSISFLDLLSGALGAVIILFIVVPKMTSEQQQTIETLDELNIQVETVAEMIEQLEHSVDREVAEALSQQVEQLQETAQRARQAAEQLQQENEQLREELRTEQEARRRAQQRTEEARQATNTGRGPEMFGVSAEFAVISKWQENIDVDLYLKDVSSGKWCFYRQTDPGFAKYLADIQHRERQDDNSYEMVYQQVLKPGTYEVYIHLYTPSGTANVETYAVFYPYTPREIKKPLPSRPISHNAPPPLGGGYKLATIVLKQNEMIVQ